MSNAKTDIPYNRSDLSVGEIKFNINTNVQKQDAQKELVINPEQKIWEQIKLNIILE
jgi:hypothetical protein